MENNDWIKRWQDHKIGWHTDRVFPPLKKYWSRLELPAGSSVLVPLCGKSVDLDWLAERGHYVVGVEISTIAIREVINRQPQTFAATHTGSFHCYKSSRMELWRGDFFKLSPARLPSFDAIYDRAALIALPAGRRRRYAGVLQSFSGKRTQMLLCTFEYEQAEMDGPPFAIFEKELHDLFGGHFALSLLLEHNRSDLQAKFQRRGLQSDLTEKVYHLTSRENT